MTTYSQPGGRMRFVEECVVVEAVGYEPVSTLLFPANREMIRKNQDWTPRLDAKRVSPYGLSAANLRNRTGGKIVRSGCRALPTENASAGLPMTRSKLWTA